MWLAPKGLRREAWKERNGGRPPAGARSARRADESRLAAVELDDQLLLDGQLDVLAAGHAEHLARHVLGPQLEPIGDAAPARALDGGADEVVLAAPLLDDDGLALAGPVGGGGDLAPVDGDVAVAHQLARLGPRRGEAEAVDHVVEPALEQNEQVDAGDPLAPLRLVEVLAELLLEDPVDALDLLLLAQLGAVVEAAAAAPLPVLAGWVTAPLDGALLLEAALPLEEELHALAAAEPADRTGVACHVL